MQCVTMWSHGISVIPEPSVHGAFALTMMNFTEQEEPIFALLPNEGTLALDVGTS